MSIEQLTSRHLAMLERLVIDGVQAKAVCEEFEITPSRLSVLRASPMWKIEEDKLRTQLRSEKVNKALSRLEDLVPLAVDAYEDTVIDERDPRLRLQSAKEILDRVGVGKGEQKEFTPVIQLYIPKHWNNNEGKEIINVTPTTDGNKG
jgi:hypothetical protein